MADIEVEKFSTYERLRDMLDGGGNFLFTSGYKDIVDIQALYKYRMVPLNFRTSLRKLMKIFCKNPTSMNFLG